ncbi:fungal-specific transcription factor domain-containing protein [Truncatella angustata]|uniref:Fungal-specific transcription factor domain-containing protein n=1 Tax=Truncatella angustata TaxID=152316 RepID=A0A9P8URJ0_9PEZI|nr:fungal-specific transcription factor domain-containing protein [Truncatella angustata]KAH6657147.1 fungal-specific transcription factor domain-containing protein [Truncatella angustata]
MEPVRTRESLSPASATATASGSASAAASASAIASNVRRRAPAACRICRQRKVKCNVTAVGIPCLNCVRDGHSCEVSGRKRRAYPQPQPDDLMDSRGVAGFTSTSSSVNLPSPTARSQPPILTPITTPPSVSTTSFFALPSGIPDEVDRKTAIEADGCITMNQDGAVSSRGPDDYAIESLASSLMEDTAEATTETFYVGDQQGIGYILDIVGEPSMIPQHYALPYMAATQDLMPQDIAYLRSKGVFSVPTEPVCQALLAAYFQHIHPILPVVDAASVLTTFHNGGASAVNILLLWSMFSVAANYVDKAVCYYDNGCEKDRISIIQSVSLLAFWYSDLGERTESWHWMGIAIGLSQTLGLNRDPDRGQYNKRLSNRQRQLWRRIWWSCFFRDRWLSLGMGRPMRINTRDCDTPMPSAEDLTTEFNELSPLVRDRYMPFDFRQLADHWVVLLHLSKALGTILSENYRATGPLPSRTWVEATEQELQHCIADAGERSPDASPALSFYSYHLRLHFNAALIALWRPYASRIAADVPSDQEAVWFALVQQKIRTAASNTNTVLDKVISDQLIGYIGPMTVPLLVPAMNSHLLESKSLDPLIRQSSLNKLDLFMIVLRKVQDIYSSATFIHGLFLQAIEKLTSPQYTGTNTPLQISQRQNSITDSTSQVISQDSVNHITIDNFWQFDDPVFDVWDLLPTFSGAGTPMATKQGLVVEK